MKKETVLKVFAHCCLLIPGNLKSRKAWFISILSLLSLVALTFTVGGMTFEIIGYQLFTKGKPTSKAYQKLEHKPARYLVFCLKQEKDSEIQNETIDEVATTVGVNTSLIPFGNSGWQQQPTTKPPKKMNQEGGRDVLEDIINTAYRLIVFGVNILVRIFVMINFPTIIDLLHSVFVGQEGRSKVQNSFMTKLWLTAAKEWTSGEKVYVVIIILSLILREVDMYMQFSHSIHYVGPDLFDMKCVVMQILVEQARILFTKELVMEAATFALLIVIKAFIKVLIAIAGPPEDDSEEDVYPETLDELKRVPKGRGNFSSNEETETDPDLLFVKTQAMLLKAEMNTKVVGKGRGSLTLPNGMNNNYGHVSEIVSGYEPDNPNDLGMIFQTRQKQAATSSSTYYNGEDSVEIIYSKMNFIISMYFELMGIWERAGRLTGFITLILFSELTTKFCFNTYVTLDNSVEFGLLSVFGILGLLRGVVIVTKFICMCNAAQELKDMTPVLLDRILKLKLQLLSLPGECYRKSSSKLGNGKEYGGSLAPYECERCRGLGSFLSEMVSYIRSHPFELSALGYFTVSRSTLTTITGVIVTYLVVLVQFQSYSTSS